MSKWNEYKLGDLGNTYTGLSGKKKEDFGRGANYIPYLNILENSRIDPEFLDHVQIRPGENQNSVRRGDIFFTTSSETVEDVGMTSVLLDDLPETYLNSFCFGFRPYDFETVLPEFFAHFLRSEKLRREISYLGQGSTRYNISKTQLLRRLVIRAPEIDEQRRIAMILNSANAAISKTETLIAKLKQMKEGLLHDLLTRGIDENGQLRKLPLGIDIPIEWKSVSANDVSDEITVGVVCNATRHYVPFGVPFLRSQNVRPNCLDANDILYIAPQFNKLQCKSILTSGDVIITRTGANIGMACVVPECFSGANCFSLVVVKPNRRLLDGHYLSYFLNSEKGVRRIAQKYFGSAQANFNVGEMKELTLPLPPLVEQKEIVRRLQLHEGRLAHEQTIVDKLKKMKCGLVQDLLDKQLNLATVSANT